MAQTDDVGKMTPSMVSAPSMGSDDVGKTPHEGHAGLGPSQDEDEVLECPLCFSEIVDADTACRTGVLCVLCVRGSVCAYAFVCVCERVGICLMCVCAVRLFSWVRARTRVCAVCAYTLGCKRL